MANEFLGRLIPGMGGGGGGMMDMIMAISIGSMALLFIAGLVYYFFWKRITWNISVEFRFPRNIKKGVDEYGNEVVTGTIKKEWGRGFYNPKTGIVYIKRKKKKPVTMKPFNVKEFLSDNNILTVLQVGIEDYRPVLEDSYLEVVDYDTGEEAALLKTKIDTSEDKSWRNSFERERKSIYSIGGLLKENMGFIVLGWVTICMFVGFSILYSKVA